MEGLPFGFELSTNYSLEDYLAVIKESKNNNHWFKASIETCIIILYVIIIVFGIVSNGFIVVLICCKKSLQTTRNMFLVNLAISDILLCSVCTPFTLLKLILKNWHLGTLMCKLVPWFQGVLVFASTLTITCIALDRYYMIVHPLGSTEKSKKVWVSVCIIVIWLASALISSPLFLFSTVSLQTYMNFVKYEICLENWPQYMSKFLYGSTIMILQFVIPIAVLMTLHWKICNFLRSRINSDPKSVSEMQRAFKDVTRHRKNTTLLMAIALMFALCWFPLTLLNMLADFNFKIFMFENFLLSYALAHMIAMISACMNPILYGWFNSNFRREFASFFCNRKSQTKSAIQDEVLPEEKVVVYKQNMSYKAIQTEVQPVFGRLIKRDFSDRDTEAMPFGSSTSGKREYGSF